MNKKILVVDDESSICHILKEILEYEGYEVRTTTSGDDAVVQMAACRYDAMLVDIRLEGSISGIEVIRGLKELEHKPKILVISATPQGELDGIFRQEGLSDCVHRILEKPDDLRPESLVRVVGNVLKN